MPINDETTNVLATLLHVEMCVALRKHLDQMAARIQDPQVIINYPQDVVERYEIEHTRAKTVYNFTHLYAGRFIKLLEELIKES